MRLRQMGYLSEEVKSVSDVESVMSLQRNNVQN